MERGLTLELVRVTEAAALASAEWVGRGLKMEADDAATGAMRAMLDTVPMDGTVVIGEGEMDEAPMLYIGEQVGAKRGPAVDVAVDPVEGTELVAKGLDSALAVIAIADRGQFLHAPDMYMEKLAVGPALAGKVRLEDPIEITVRIASEVLRKPISRMTVSLLERDRHTELTERLRKLGVKLKLLPAGDVAGAMAPAFEESGVDLYVGSGGAPEGVLAAAALACMGGELQGRLMFSEDSERERQRCVEMGIADPTKILTMQDLVGTGDVIFAATGITHGSLLEGVNFTSGDRASTHSMVMRASTRTIRFVKSVHYMPVKTKIFA
ncbi:class II fructose-bisphosphatase [Paenibacillus turpanensis]|uniref:class II fructose-bisphosphatase n=1 Tax=Paenibacillus turpanensis TaxID=2689078 RepID=UPI001408B381|nr:class II fructose-bisphosphatase [Paenibacillus turpanensis]